MKLDFGKRQDERECTCCGFMIILSVVTSFLAAIMALYICAIVIAHNNENNPCLKDLSNVSVHYITWLYIYGGTSLGMLFIGLSVIVYHMATGVVTDDDTSSEKRMHIIIIPFGLFMTAWMIYGAVLYWEEVAPHCSNELKQYGLANFIIYCIGWGMSVLSWLVHFCCRVP